MSEYPLSAKDRKLKRRAHVISELQGFLRQRGYDLRRANETIEALRARVRELEEALRTYGAHTDECWVNEGLERGCNCGFSAFMLKEVKP